MTTPAAPPDDGAWGVVHGALDMLGFIPKLGAVPDLVNAGIYAARGKHDEARMSAIAAIPYVGDAAKAVKLGLRASRETAEDAAPLAGRRVLGDIPWSSPTVRRAAKELQEGAITVYLPSKEEAEEVFLRLYVGRTPHYRNTTGMTSTEARRFFDGRAQTYHRDDQVGSDGRLIGHPKNDPHAQYRHIQVHTKTKIIVIAYGEPLVWP
jgi:hypothetical protein